jgi:sec-independent protein translocase protein TatC
MAYEPEELPEHSEEEEGGPVKPFLEHLEDLRWVLIKCVSALLIGMVICMTAAPQLIAVLQLPLKWSGTGIQIQWIDPMGGFWASMKLGLFGGIVLSLPFLLYFIGDFVIPALKKNERKYFGRAVVIGAGLFLSGVALCYFLMLKMSLRAIAQYNRWLNVPTEFWRADQYFSFVSWFMLGMGLSFELPVLILTLVKIGVLEHRTLVKSRKYIFVINLVVCSFITPDPVTTIFMVVPMTVLLEICILISAYWERQKKTAEAALLASGVEQGSTPD